MPSLSLLQEISISTVLRDSAEPKRPLLPTTSFAERLDQNCSDAGMVAGERAMIILSLKKY